MTNNLAIRILSGEVLGTNEQTHEAVYMAIKALKAEPVRHGHWDIYYNDNIPYTLKCSECGEYTIVNGKFCPNCGCKMDEVNDD